MNNIYKNQLNRNKQNKPSPQSKPTEAKPIQKQEPKPTINQPTPGSLSKTITSKTQLVNIRFKHENIQAMDQHINKTLAKGEKMNRQILTNLAIAYYLDNHNIE